MTRSIAPFLDGGDQVADGEPLPALVGAGAVDRAAHVGAGAVDRAAHVGAGAVDRAAHVGRPEEVAS